VALPKGRLLSETAALLKLAGWELSDYSENARLYHLTSASFPELTSKIFHEKDIPVQVAIGNYDLGVCGLDWIQELLVKYPSAALVKLKDLSYGSLALYLAAGAGSHLESLRAVQSLDRVISLASEYPNLAESQALELRLKRFNIFPLWGAAEIYPPENADLVLLDLQGVREFGRGGLVPLIRVLNSNAYLIANKNSWENKNLSRFISSLYSKLGSDPADIVPEPSSPTRISINSPQPQETIRLALPDGHAQKHVVNILNKACLKISDYPSASGNRQPQIELPGFSIKVIRPQDMPLQVATGKFDVAITGLDWILEHLYKFPSSPICRLLNLKYSRVKVVAAVHNDLPVENIAGLRQYASDNGLKIRLASEYVTIADKYARDNHLGVYRIIPTWGATEAFIPDDADMLIENTETGGTLKRHNLKIIETLFESTAWIIANTESLNTPKGDQIRCLATRLAKTLEES
jgi:ATP phosphoribosyltransferase